MPTPSLPVPPKKYEYENAQFDPESPSTLDGVMQRWVVPEGEEEKEPVVMVVPPRIVHIEGGLFADADVGVEEENQGNLDEEDTHQSGSSAQVSFSPSFYFIGGFIFLMAFNLAFLIFILLTRK